MRLLTNSMICQKVKYKCQETMIELVQSHSIL